MDKQHEIWAEALWVDQHKGPEGPDFIAEQVTRLALLGDEAGMARWRQIADAYDRLITGQPQ